MIYIQILENYLHQDKIVKVAGNTYPRGEAAQWEQHYMYI